MCHHASFVVTIDRVYWLPRSDSHTEIQRAHQLHTDGARSVNVVCAELWPPVDPATVDDLDTWEHHLDQDTTPEWYDAADVASRVCGAADLRRSIDPVMWAIQTAATRMRDYTAEQRQAILGDRWRGANLDGANLARANLDGAYLYGANLARANLYGANLYGANLDGANLARANLDGAYLDGAYLDGANLAGAYLDGANLAGAYLAGANLDGANLDGANLDGAWRFATDPPIAGWTVVGERLTRTPAPSGGKEE